MTLACYRCGTTLESLTLPLSRRDQCQQCSADLHVCAMCVHFDRTVAKQCREDDAEEVTHKERVNFCEWFVPSEAAFDPGRKASADAARAALDALFDGDAGASAAPVPDELDKLFK